MVLHFICKTILHTNNHISNITPRFNLYNTLVSYSSSIKFFYKIIKNNILTLKFKCLNGVLGATPNEVFVCMSDKKYPRPCKKVFIFFTVFSMH